MSDNHKSVEQVIREMMNKSNRARALPAASVIDITETEEPEDDVIIEPLEETEETEAEINEVSAEKLGNYIRTASRWAREDGYLIGNDIGKRNAENKAKLKPGESMPIHTPDDFDDHHRAALLSRNKRTGPNGITLAVSKLVKKAMARPVAEGKMNAASLAAEHPAVTKVKRALADSAPNGQHGYDVEHMGTTQGAISGVKCNIHHVKISKTSEKSYDGIQKNAHKIAGSLRDAGVKSLSGGHGFGKGDRPGHAGTTREHHIRLVYEPMESK